MAVESVSVKDTLSLLDIFLQYVVIPLGGFIWVLYTRQSDHHVDIAVIKSRADLDKHSHEREMGEIRETTNKIFAKLDSIEENLRK